MQYQSDNFMVVIIARFGNRNRVARRIAPGASPLPSSRPRGSWLSSIEGSFFRACALGAPADPGRLEIRTQRAPHGFHRSPQPRANPPIPGATKSTVPLGRTAAVFRKQRISSRGDRGNSRTEGTPYKPRLQLRLQQRLQQLLRRQRHKDKPCRHRRRCRDRPWRLHNTRRRDMPCPRRRYRHAHQSPTKSLRRPRRYRHALR